MRELNGVEKHNINVEHYFFRVSVFTAWQNRMEKEGGKGWKE
jgi:hypothetical protein